MEEIENVKLKFSCQANWDEMHSVNGGKHCDLCQKKVYDFTNANQNDLIKILSQNNNQVCGRFRSDQVTVNHISLFNWKKWVSAAMVLIGINIFNNKVEAQNVRLKQNASVKEEEFVNGIVGSSGKMPDRMAEFTGGTDAFNHFISTNIRYKKGMKNGRVLASFDIDKDGTLFNLKILKKVSPLNDNEVIRVLKLSPKWKPATLKGKPVRVSYSVPIKFEG